MLCNDPVLISIDMLLLPRLHLVLWIKLILQQGKSSVHMITRNWKVLCRLVQHKTSVTRGTVVHVCTVERKHLIAGTSSLSLPLTASYEIFN